MPVVTGNGDGHEDHAAVDVEAVAVEPSGDTAEVIADQSPMQVASEVDFKPSQGNDERFVDIYMDAEDDTHRMGADLETGFSDADPNHKPIKISELPSTEPPSDAPPSKVELSYDMRRMLFGFALCCLSTFVSHVLRMPLSSTKVNLQRSMDLSTRDLTHLDASYAICHVLGQMSTPALSSKSNSVVLVALYQFSMGFAMMLLFAPSQLYYFILVYGFTGFMTAPTWSVLFSHLSEWLPKEYSLPLITVWFTGADLGSIAGIMICIYAEATWGWRSTYVVSGLLNIAVAIMLFSLYDNCKDPMSDGRLVDPPAIIRANITTMSKYVRQIGQPRYMETFIESKEQPPVTPPDSHRNFILSGISNVNQQARVKDSRASYVFYSLCSRISTLFGKVRRMTIDYVSVLYRVSYMGRIALSSFVLKLVKHCFCSWVNFYVSTMYGFTPAQGNYLTLTLSVGCCVGNILVALVCRILWKDRPLTACMYFYGLSAIAVFLFSLMDFSWLLLSYFCCCLCGIVTTAAEAILMARGIKSLCERSKLTQRESLTVYGFILAASTLGSVCQGFLVASIVDWYGWSALLGLFVAALMCATALLHKPSQTEK
ncbi:uncharacterized protein BXIN_0026 [Babesia sp. Xinjiang]|uniref:uncharacterized protein n=1 Tax=Babesia sp. Xinjiang TaxID=462227 RepID=UPI000A254CEE|nr:uncharacterized protein BXIN_0026 [Babesia sp. Xinjiang]ORM39752.1 hypothetical protein BXIN_0026 [Babesia sp. Xinjiang]